MISAHRQIATHYLPSRYHYWYARSKLSSDPLYAGVQRALLRTSAPLLDVGCGIGLLAHALRAAAASIRYLGVDSDQQKIELARAAAGRAGLLATQFEVCDLMHRFPKHAGSVALLDVVQYFSVQDGRDLIAHAAHCVTEEGCLIMRVGLDDGGWRAQLTRTADRFGHLIRWMKTPPRSQLKRQDLTELLACHGLQARFEPLWGRTPFNNWLVIGSRS